MNIQLYGDRQILVPPEVKKCGHWNVGENNPMFGRTGTRHPRFGKKDPEHSAFMKEYYAHHQHQNLGKKQSEDMRRKISGENCHWWRGGKKEYNCEICGKVFTAYLEHGSRKRRFCSVGCNAQSLSDRHRGDKNPCWKGGTTPERNKFVLTPEYKTWRKQVFERDEYSCLICGKNGGDIHAHHIIPYFSDIKGRLEVQNGMTICRQHHHALHHSRFWLDLYNSALSKQGVVNA